MKPSSPKSVRCAIYTRVSTDHGLDQEFNSLDAQLQRDNEAASGASIRMRMPEAWNAGRA